MKLSHYVGIVALASTLVLSSCSKGPKTTIEQDPLLKLIPQDAQAFFFSDYTHEAAKKFRQSPAVKNSANQIEEQISKLKEVDPKLAEAMQSVMKAIPGNIGTSNSSIDKMIAFYRPVAASSKPEADPTKAESEPAADIAVRVSFNNEQDVSVLVENIKKGVLGGITATTIPEGLRIEASQQESAPIVFYVCHASTNVVAAIIKESCAQLLASQPPAEAPVAPLVAAFPKDSIDPTTTMIAGVNLEKLLAQTAPESPIAQESALKNAFISSGFNGALTTGIDIFFTQGDPKVDAFIHQFKEFSGKTIPHRTPDVAPLSLSVALPSGVSADLSLLLQQLAPALSSVSIKSIACGLFENDEGAIPAIACAIENSDSDAIVRQLKTQLGDLITAQTGMNPSWQESINEGMKTATFMTPLGFGVSLGSKSPYALIGSTTQALAQMSHGATTKNTMAPSAPLFAHIKGTALYDLIQSSLESAKLFGVDTSQYDQTFNGLTSYNDVFFSAEIFENRVRGKAVAYLSTPQE